METPSGASSARHFSTPVDLSSATTALPAPPAILIRVRDTAPPFDPTRLPDPDLTLPLEERPVGGLGAFIFLTLRRERRQDTAVTPTATGTR